jgi:putative acetyltransferase
VDWVPAYKNDAERIIGAVFAEYGFGFYPNDYDSDLRRIPEVYLDTGGMFRFLLTDSRPVGTIAVKPLEGGRCELKRMYLLHEYRGRGHGRLLLDEAVTWARASGYSEMIAWSDTRFVDAHRLYQQAGFEQIAVRPEPGPDPAHEFGFRLIL